MLRTIVVPSEYKPMLNLRETAEAIHFSRKTFQEKLEQHLNLMQIPSPVLLQEGTGINDNLNGVERMVSFDALDMEEGQVEVVQSLAKWKRIALKTYGFQVGEGLYTVMNAIRRDEWMDNLHSIYVDQWDWEKVIAEEQRNLTTLKEEVHKIYRSIQATEQELCKQYSCLEPVLPAQIFFITTQELEYQYPDLTPKQRENEITRQYGAVFIMQVGGVMESGSVHDGRSPDYDDWTLNGDILLWYPVLEQALEVSSMGIRVDAVSLEKQLALSQTKERAALDFHQSVLNGELPFTIGGGIGQSRLCMFLLRKAHIGEVQASVWNQRTWQECQEGNIPLL
ncbi:aspartate--ammonia ligase [Paenibacillus xylanilyticus]|uniref:Aspartate--ammonia ligase n=1 Tax=Paenibacillus xylanilyticus TaxID=248903 RepID=A0A7Y6EUQ8_9BACL|nr:aspartate--ammonia ligase [Paenibacillus xylanilyticus]NUU74964.1 aspartate--ammonia ligase [Paenibacillus xylanilyticus]